MAVGLAVLGGVHRGLATDPPRWSGRVVVVPAGALEETGYAGAEADGADPGFEPAAAHFGLCAGRGVGGGGWLGFVAADVSELWLMCCRIG